MSALSLTALIDEVDQWEPVHWWRLEIRSFDGAGSTQRNLAMLAPKEAVATEYRKVTAGSCLQAVAYMFALVAPTVGAITMVQWAMSGSRYDFPLNVAGILTLLTLLVTGWGELQERRHPRAATQSAVTSTVMLALVPSVITAIVALTAGRDYVVGGQAAWLIVIGAMIVVDIILLVRGPTRRGGPQNPHENVQQSIREIPAETLRGMVTRRDAAIALLSDRGLIDAETAARARATVPGELALTMAPEVGSAYYRPDLKDSSSE